MTTTMHDYDCRTIAALRQHGYGHDDEPPKITIDVLKTSANSEAQRLSLGTIYDNDMVATTYTRLRNRLQLLTHGYDIAYAN